MSELKVFISTRESRCDYDELLARGVDRGRRHLAEKIVRHAGLDPEA